MPPLGGGGELELLPPQATKAAASRTRNSDPKASFNRRLFVGTISRKKAAKIAPPRGTNQRGLLNRPITVDGAVVFTVSVVVLPGINEVEASRQLPPVIADGTEQLKLTVPVKPLMAVGSIVVLPDAPGAEMANEAGFATKLKSGVPPEMVIVVAEEVVEAE